MFTLLLAEIDANIAAHWFAGNWAALILLAALVICLVISLCHENYILAALLGFVVFLVGAGWAYSLALYVKLC